jgi:hypothetical protein
MSVLAPNGDLDAAALGAADAGQMTKLTESEAVASAEPRVRNSGSARSGITEIPYTRLGLTIFRAILLLITLLLIGLFLFSIVTYPTADDARAILGPDATGTAAANELEAMQAQWFDQVKQLAQYLVFGSVLPLLATVIGYLLGQRQAS